MSFVVYPSGAATAVPDHLTSAVLEELLGGKTEVIQLDAEHCLVVNSQAREMHLPKNRDASDHWFARHPECAQSADFILGPAVYCRNSDLAFDPLETAPPKPVLTARERAERWAPSKVFTPEEALACSLDNPGACEACGS